MRGLQALVSISLLASPASGAVILFNQTSVNDVDASIIAAVSSQNFLDSSISYSTVTAPSTFNELRFTHWTNDTALGTSYRDAWGRSLNPATMVLDRNTTATAHYLPSGRDVDSDGVPDW